MTTVGYLVDVQAPALDTIRLRIGTRRLRERYIGGGYDSAYDTLYSSAAYVRAGNSFQAMDPQPPFPFLDRAYVNASDTIPPGFFGTGFRIDNLAAALHGEPAECTHIFTYAYAGGGAVNENSGVYRQGIGMTAAGFPGTSILLMSAKR